METDTEREGEGENETGIQRGGESVRTRESEIEKGREMHVSTPDDL